jgi:DNA-binding response OmpR family regulator
MPDSSPPGTVLILDDDLGVARLQRVRLERSGYAVESTATPDETLDRIRRGGIDLLVLDNQLATAG